MIHPAHHTIDPPRLRAVDGGVLSCGNAAGPALPDLATTGERRSDVELRDMLTTVNEVHHRSVRPVAEAPPLLGSHEERSAMRNRFVSWTGAMGMALALIALTALPMAGQAA